MNEKAAIRAEVLKKRDAIDIDVRKAKDVRIKKNLFSLPEFQQARIIFYFASFRSEVSTIAQIEEALAHGKRVLLPFVDNKIKGLRLYEVKSLSELSPGYMGILEPSVSEDRRMEINDAELAIMPGVAFDSAGNRLGYGAGLYDKLLSGLKRQMPLIAIAYIEQIVDNIPSQPHDVRVHKIVTDEKIIECK